MAKMFQDDDGNTSSIRILAIAVVALYMIVWTIISLWKMEVQRMELGEVAFIFIPLAGKVTQKAFENKKRKKRRRRPDPEDEEEEPSPRI